MSDPRLDALAALTRRQGQLSAQIRAVAAERRTLLRELLAAGHSKRHLATVMGLDRNRIYQLLRDSGTPNKGELPCAPPASSAP